MAAPYDLDDVEITNIVETGLTLAGFKAAAAMFISETLAGKGLSDDRLHQITLYFCAHLVVLSEETGGLKRTRLGEIDEVFKAPGEQDTGLAYTRFGQVCMILDTSGVLASITSNKGLKAKFEVASATYDRPAHPPWFF